MNALWDQAKRQVPGWQSITLRVPQGGGSQLGGASSTFSIDSGDGGRPDKRSQLTLDRSTGAVIRWEPFSSYNTGRRLRTWIRFTHTGESGGLLGETIAALAASGAALLVFTGLSMALRRLFSTFARRSQTVESSKRARDAVRFEMEVRMQNEALSREKEHTSL
jgi:uncharacterized iron-regulated membrane protein